MDFSVGGMAEKCPGKTATIQFKKGRIEEIWARLFW
jgi:hypothetical protein